MSIPQLADRVRTEGDAYAFLEELRWGDKPICPHCGSVRKPYFLKPSNGTSRTTRRGTSTERRLWKCADCRRQFTVTVGTVFHGSKIPIRTWLFIIFEMVSSKNSVSGRVPSGLVVIVPGRVFLDTASAPGHLARKRDRPIRITLQLLGRANR